MSSLDTRRILGSTARLSWISSGFAWLLRFDDGVAERVTCVGDETGSEGSKTRFDELPPMGIIVDLIGVGAIGSDGDAVLAGLPCLEFEGVDCGSIDIMRNTLHLFKIEVHMREVLSYTLARTVKFYSSSNINAIAA